MPVPRPRLPARLVIAGLAAMLVLPVLPGAALGWAHNSDGYSTHDWFIDQAVAVLDGRAASWFDAETARLASDDPDTDPALAIQGDHVYRGTGRRGGAVQRISELYSAALANYRAGADARAASNEPAARASFTEASRDIGLLSHYLTDILQPYHSAYAGINKVKLHRAYERLVDKVTHRASDSRAWHNPSRSVSEIANIRTTAVAAAAYSRAKFAALHAEMKRSPGALTARARDITGKLARRAARDLANIIWSISRGAGESPDVATLRASIKWVGVAAREPYQTLFVTARDARGRPIEGLEVVISWPLADGSTQTERRWTDPKGRARYTTGVGGGTLMVRRYVTISATATTPAATKTATTWFMATRPLADGRAGFKAVATDTTVKPGETAVVRTVARDRLGRPMAGLLVTWTWQVGTKTIRTKGLTDADGRALGTLPVTASMSSRITVTAHVQAASHNRYSSTILRRV